MYLDLSNNLSINVKTVQLFGLQVAAYWAALEEVLRCVKKKNTFDENGFFSLKRAYIEERTGLGVDEQLVCDAALANVGIVNTSDETDRISVNMEKMIALIVDDDPKSLAGITKAIKVTAADKKAAKKAGMIVTMKKLLVEQDEDVHAAYCNWIDAIYESKTKGFLTKAILADFQAAINTYTQDKATKIKLLEIARNQAYRDASWCINSYERSVRSNIGTLKVSGASVTGQAAEKPKVRTDIEF